MQLFQAYRLIVDATSLIRDLIDFSDDSYQISSRPSQTDNFRIQLLRNVHSLSHLST